MNLYHSKITKNIFHNCTNFWNKIIIEDIYWNMISWTEYKNSALSYALKLKKQWIKKGDSIIIFIKDITKFSYIGLSVLLVWAKLVIIEAEYSQKILEDKLKFIKPDLVIIEWFLYYLLKVPFVKKLNKIKKYNSLLEYSKNIIINNNFENNLNLSIKEINYIDSDNENEALVVFTWWTTWSPKWVVHTLESLEIMFKRINIIIWEEIKIFYADLPHFVLMWISMGVKVIVWENNISDKKFLNILEQFKVDTTFSPPYRYLNILNKEKNIPKYLKHICLWSAPIYKSFLEKLYNNIEPSVRVSCVYWMTELLPISCVNWREKLNKSIEWDLLWKAFDDIKINILEDGELEVFWTWLFKKYLWWEIVSTHNTWDLVSLEDWNLIMKWRKKDMILRRNYNIYPSLYESIINSIPWVIENALVWIFDSKLEDEKIILFIEWINLSKEKIFWNLSKWKYSIDTFALPDDIVLRKIPRKWRQNKVDKNYLRNNYKKIWK